MFAWDVNWLTALGSCLLYGWLQEPAEWGGEDAQQQGPSFPPSDAVQDAMVRAYAQTAPLITRLSHPSTAVQLKIQYRENYKKELYLMGLY